MTRHAPQCMMAAVHTLRSPGSLVPGPRHIAQITRYSAPMDSAGPPFVSKTPDYASLALRSIDAPPPSETIQKPFYP